MSFAPCRLAATLIALWAALPVAAFSQDAPEQFAPGDQARELVSEATELRVSAQSIADLGRVIELCREALAEEEVPADVRAYAETLLYGSYVERGMAVVNGVVAAAAQGQIRQSDFQRQRNLALDDFEHAREINDEDPVLRLAIARAQALPGGDREVARREVDAALDRLDDDAAKSEAYTLRAGLRGSPEEMLEDLDRAIELHDGNGDALRARALVHVQREEFDLAAEDFRRAVELDPDNMEQLGAYAGALLIGEEYEKALDIYTKLAGALPDNPALSFRRGYILARLERFEEALPLIEESLRLQPDEPAVLLEKTDVLIQLGRFAEAADTVGRLIELQPDNPAFRLEAARLYLVGKRPRKSIELLDALAEQEDVAWQVFRLRADAHLNIAAHAEAIRDYEQVLEREPNDGETLNNLAWVLATSPHDDLRDAERAIELAKRACELTDYEAAHILSTLAAGYAEQGDFETAIEWSQKAVELEEQDADEGDGDDIAQQLRDELQSYRDGKPWREQIETEEEADEPSEPRLGPNDA